MRSYIIIAIYSILVAAFYNWEASLFVLMASIFLELILLFIGSLIIGKRSNQRMVDVGRSGAFYLLTGCIAFIYPMAFMMGDTYEEYTDPAIYGYAQPIIDYKWELLALSFSLGIGYLLDFNSLKNRTVSAHLSTEIFRVSFLLFGIGLLGMMCIEFIGELADHQSIQIPFSENDTPYTKKTKMITILILTSARIGIEIWFLLSLKKKRLA